MGHRTAEMRAAHLGGSARNTRADVALPQAELPGKTSQW
eukprot:CAMPEP_0176259304 /NCGR_PEP_ID=MMETSP0121_2-20121125/39005_1 /TAXON_ID=160619 /ORGANISM="Kryptoperidinium foliaceum, Strain CCMP 1326" /LENGTH=38 /DNA_ID= /DNA_START= /DNA_END= /DNA_ORIENTATION=